MNACKLTICGALILLLSLLGCSTPTPEERDANIRAWKEKEREFQLPRVTADLGWKEVVEVLDIPTMHSKAVVYCRNPHPGKPRCDGFEDTAILEVTPEPGVEIAEVYVRVVALGNRSTNHMIMVAYPVAPNDAMRH